MPPSLPTAVAARFQKRIGNVLRDLEELLLAVHHKRRQASLETMIAEQSVMLTAVLWEAFINDLLVSYVIQDPRSCLDNFETRFRQSIGDKFAGVSRWVSLEFPSLLSQVQAEKLLDPKGWNVGAGSAQQLSDLANRHLSAVTAKKFSLQVDDRDFVDYFVSLRNYLSHRSHGSRVKFLDSMKALKAGGQNAHLIGQVRDVSTYLKYRIPAVGIRANVIGQRAIEISGKLV